MKKFSLYIKCICFRKPGWTENILNLWCGCFCVKSDIQIQQLKNLLTIWIPLRQIEATSSKNLASLVDNFCSFIRTRYVKIQIIHVHIPLYDLLHTWIRFCIVLSFWARMMLCKANLLNQIYEWCIHKSLCVHCSSRGSVSMVGL